MHGGRADSTEAIERLEHNLLGLWMRFGRGDGCALHDDGGATSFDTPMACSMYERIGFRVQADFRIFAPPGALHL